MFKNSNKTENPFFQLIITLFFGALIGGLTVIFVKTLAQISFTQQYLNQVSPYHLLLGPVVYYLFYLIRRRSLYFPIKISQVVPEVSSSYWSVAMAPVHFFGTLLTHISGLSVGREGAVVLFSAGLVRLFNLSWLFWGPILASIGFASVIGQALLAPVFMFEIFRKTSFLQKLLSYLGAFVAVNVAQSFQLPTLFKLIDLSNELGFFNKLFIFFIFGLFAGLIMRYYKKAHLILTDYFYKAHIIIKLTAVLVLVYILSLPQFRMYQSLGLSQFYDLESLQGSYLVSLTKLGLTLVATSLGFLGGEFIPLIFAGSYFGAAFFASFGYSSVLGGCFGAFILFAAGTRLKWTSLFLMLSLLGGSWWFWVYYVLSITLAFSGTTSLYKRETDSVT